MKYKAKLISNRIENLEEALSLIKAYLEAGKHPDDRTPVSKEDVDHQLNWLLEDVERRTGGKATKVTGGHLKVSVAWSRPVTIIYEDDGSEDFIITIPQIALVGSIETPERIFTLRQIWIGRVFPQWKILGTKMRTVA